MLIIAPGCRIMGSRPELATGRQIVAGVMAKYGYDCTIVHCLDGVHSRASIHYAGGADDYRSKHIKTTEEKLKIEKECQLALGPDFDFQLEGLGTANEHFHNEFQPKDSY
jgi:hypothetical protein